jgi:hypothetical protein
VLPQIERRTIMILAKELGDRGLILGVGGDVEYSSAIAGLLQLKTFSHGFG